MIELIFVIVILGILAIIAIPKLSATRDDALKVTDINSLANCLNDIASAYTSRGKEDNSSSFCSQVKCAIVNLGNLNDGNITVTLKDSSNGYPKFCDYVKITAQKKNLGGEHSFSGVRTKP